MTLIHLVGPEHVFTHMAHLTTPEEYRALGLQCAGRTFEPAAKAYVFIDDSRLLIDCECRNGVLVSLKWQLACCLAPGCGAVYTADTLIFPADMDVLDELLGKRHPLDRDFYPHRGETLDDVVEWNTKKGLL